MAVMQSSYYVVWDWEPFKCLNTSTVTSLYHGLDYCSFHNTAQKAFVNIFSYFLRFLPMTYYGVAASGQPGIEPVTMTTPNVVS